ncbi:centrosomal protein 15 isoform X2 [Sphaeramia orbicularis]|nr:uncharacterized protein C3orf14 homolog isoform X2 [Sphaeramia orbicularis]
MDQRYHQIKVQKKQRLKEREDARIRNDALMQHLQKLEAGLRAGRLPDPTLQALETRYWASVEESVPAWELFLQGKGPHPIDSPGSGPGGVKQAPSKDHGRPPRPRPGPVRR